MRGRLAALLFVSMVAWWGSVSSADAPTVPVTTTSTTSSTSTSTTSTSTTSTSTTTIPAGDWVCATLMPVALEAGFPVGELPMVDRIMARESACNPQAFNGSDPGSGSYGLMQVNGAAWCDGNTYHPIGWLQEQGIVSSCDDLFDPLTNLRAAFAIRTRQDGFGAWGF